MSRHVSLICVTVKSNDASQAEGYKVLNVLSDSPLRYMNPFYFFRLRKYLKQTGASVLIIEHPYYGWLGVLLKWFTGVQLAVHSHNIEGLRFKTIGKPWWRILSWYERFTHRRANFNFFIHDDDRHFAIRNFKLDPARCITMTYGIEWGQPPALEDLESSAKKLRALHNIADDEKILLFNGAFNYKPNLDALMRIIDTINPLLQQKQGFKYRIIICGRDIPPQIQPGPNMLIVGFAEDINLYFRGADVFINPVNEGGGIKTKLVEALGNNLNAVSTQNGAIGVNPAICNGKLRVTANEDWTAFANNVLLASAGKPDIGQAYFDHFYWDNSIQKLVAFVFPQA